MDSALQPVSEAVFRALNVPSLLDPPPAGAGARRVTDNPVIEEGEEQTFPFVWYEVGSESNRSGLGPGPWLFELDLRVHVFSRAPGMAEAQRIAREVVRLLRHIRLPMVEWDNPYTAHDRVVLLPFEVLNGTKVRELVVMGRPYVEERA